MKSQILLWIFVTSLVPQIGTAQQHSPYGKSCYAMRGPGTTLSDAMLSRFEATADANAFLALAATAIRLEVTEHRTAQCRLMASGQPYDSECPAGVSIDINDLAVDLLDRYGASSEQELKELLTEMGASYRQAAAEMDEACTK